MPTDFADRTDFENSAKGLIATLDPCIVEAADGRVVWDIDAYRFLDADGADTVDPSLWRQSQLTAKHGLFQVTEGIYQVRGLDLSNMTLVESDNGVIVIDPLISSETAAAALALYRQHRGNKAVTAVIYTHPHIDHYGGVLGTVEHDTTVPIVAPAHFMEHAVSENVYAGTAMLRRGVYYSGGELPKGPIGRVGMGLGSAASTGTVGLLAPTLEITETGQEEVIDGVRIAFQMTPGTEAPAEMNFLFPDHRALCLAENVTHNLHNLLTLRGAQVRDARNWSRYIAEAIEMFADRADVIFASHHWPTWGKDAIVAFLTEQRDMYAYLHDQTLRLLNQGYTGIEIAEHMELPPQLDAKWHTHGYYGSVSHGVKAIYQRYLGWYDGNPAHLWQHPPEQQAKRYVELLGGVEATVAKVREYAGNGDLRFAAELGSHAVFAAPDNSDARQALADVLERLGYGSENATWRNCFLVGAHELRNGNFHTPIEQGSGLAPAMSVTQLFDTISLRIVGPKAWDDKLSINWAFTDTGERYRMELSNGALVHHRTDKKVDADLEVTLTKVELLKLIATGSLEEIEARGDTSVWSRLLACTDAVDTDFNIVTP
ncbi:alkyl/aryl-sulfatase [Nocardia africana]|uniref:Metallo-beta-lactamase superfamily n=1 Tax=Nocardia africana TaxID=134964 RepID=A0A378WWL4_9NOCA|nr:alkyl sulfatase dimerization domain-containing protein [Nocardia africana]MCC3313598.1 MBL fold metallo-hydrolase [Nocardia africana]SUA45025.1 Metallo-beta-lactamase superfamily [Nocardia africana]